MRPPLLFQRLTIDQGGQSLIEILIAVALGVLMIIAAVSGIMPSLRVNSTSVRSQVASSLGRELLENVRIVADANWPSIGTLATSSANKFYLNTASSPFSVAAGTQTTTVGTTTYSRYFYLSDVNRDGGGNITAGVGTPDPSTKKLTVIYGWTSGPTSSISTYLARSRTRIFWQTDWSGGPGQDGPVSTTNNMFSTSSNMDYSTTTGSIRILGI
ncbi:MAG TPA: hypothetical protein VMC43_01850 [Candidatus Paceibacterota bacterium]|nr:hypothetical protein [Candidatus Paceibacterota bacterium]